MDILQVIKDYGASIIATISTIGVAGIVGVVVKIKQGIDKLKGDTQKALEKKEESESALKERYTELQTTIQDQNSKLDTLTEEISRVKGNRKG